MARKAGVDRGVHAATTRRLGSNGRQHEEPVSAPTLVAHCDREAYFPETH
jgi:hypothetical protein